MAITASQKDGIDITRMATGSHTDTAASPAAISLSLGFTPRVVIMINETTIQQQTWIDGMGAADAFNAVNNAATQFSKILTGGITVSGGTVTLPAPAQNDVVRWVALG